MKKFLVIMLAVAMLATFVGCQCGTEKEKKAEFQEKSFVCHDGYGNEYEVTIKISPWILKSKNPELINEVWDEVGQGERLPETPEDWKIEHQTLSEEFGIYGQGAEAITISEHQYMPVGMFSCPGNGFDMYYAMGDVTIEKKNKGNELGEDGVFVDIGLFSELLDERYDNPIVIDENKEIFSYGCCPVKCQIFYGDARQEYSEFRSEWYGRTWESDVEASFFAVMAPDFWTKIPFVIMHGEGVLPGESEPYFRKRMVGKELTFFSSVDTASVLRTPMYMTGFSIEDCGSKTTFVLDIID